MNLSNQKLIIIMNNNKIQAARIIKLLLATFIVEQISNNQIRGLYI
jgi:hypothetical protein